MLRLVLTDLSLSQNEMKDCEDRRKKNVVDISSELKRRCDVRRAESSEVWQQVKASFELAGIELTEWHAEVVGRVLSGEVSAAQVIKDLTPK